MTFFRTTIAATLMLSAGMLSAGVANAAVLWDNGGVPIPSTNGYCNFVGSACGSIGWTVFDDFQLASASTVTGFSYLTGYYFGTTADYTSTNWSIWSSDPTTSFGLGPAFSGTTAGAISGPDDLANIKVSGLSVALAAGTYWLGLQNNTGNARTVYIASNNTRLGSASQIDNTGAYLNNSLRDASFTVSGNVAMAGAVPEPATWAMMLAGFGMIGSAARRRPSLKTTVRFA